MSSKAADRVALEKHTSSIVNRWIGRVAIGGDRNSIKQVSTCDRYGCVVKDTVNHNQVGESSAKGSHVDSATTVVQCSDVLNPNVVDDLSKERIQLQVKRVSSVTVQGNSVNQSKVLCDEMKDNGVQVYSVAFQAPASGQAVLEFCASSEDHYFEPEDGDELIATYERIAATLSNLRLTN